jgi:3',5'-cyclic AMP phosphodiesterase CpdA
MKTAIDRRDFLKLLGVGGVVFISGTAGSASGAVSSNQDDFFFVQVSDTHWGYSEPKVNPDYEGTLRKAVAAVNDLKTQPDFIVFTGDLTHTVDDPKQRRERLTGFRTIVKDLKVKDVKFLAGEHDAALDSGEAFREFFGNSSYTFDYKGVHFIAIDNVSDPRGMIGDQQLQWLAGDLKQCDKDARIVILTHRPLFDLYPQWDWATRDGAKAIELLMPFNNVTVFYGHIHQEHHHVTGHIDHHAAKGVMYPLPAPGSVPKKEPIAWDPAQPYRGLGFRAIEANAKKPEYLRTELPIKGV